MELDSLLSGLRELTQIASQKLGKATDVMSAQMCLAAANKKLDEAYRSLGEIAYKHFTGDEDLSDQVSEALQNVQNVMLEVAEARTNAEAVKTAVNAPEDTTPTVSSQPTAENSVKVQSEAPAIPVVSPVATPENVPDPAIKEPAPKASSGPVATIFHGDD